MRRPPSTPKAGSSSVSRDIGEKVLAMADGKDVESITEGTRIVWGPEREARDVVYNAILTDGG